MARTLSVIVGYRLHGCVSEPIKSVTGCIVLISVPGALSLIRKGLAVRRVV